MTILETWRNLAYGKGLNDKERENFWVGYFTTKKGIYEETLFDPTEVIEGTVKKLAEKYRTKVPIMTGFPDRVSGSLEDYEDPIGTMEGGTVVKIEINPEKLYHNMVKTKADWLYNLPMWEDALPAEGRKELYKEQKKPRTIAERLKVGRNDPCPYDSGLKYKKRRGKSQ